MEGRVKSLLGKHKMIRDQSQEIFDINYVWWSCNKTPSQGQVKDHGSVTRPLKSRIDHKMKRWEEYQQYQECPLAVTWCYCHAVITMKALFGIKVWDLVFRCNPCPSAVLQTAHVAAAVDSSPEWNQSPAGSWSSALHAGAGRPQSAPCQNRNRISPWPKLCAGAICSGAKLFLFTHTWAHRKDRRCRKGLLLLAVGPRKERSADLCSSISLLKQH